MGQAGNNPLSLSPFSSVSWKPCFQLQPVQAPKTMLRLGDGCETLRG